GNVLTQDGRPLAAATVRIDGIVVVGGSQAVTRGKCSGDSARTLSAVADGQGRYSVSPNGIGPSLLACFFVTATGVSGGVAVSGLTEVDSVLIGPGGEETVHINVTARP